MPAAKQVRLYCAGKLLFLTIEFQGDQESIGFVSLILVIELSIVQTNKIWVQNERELFFMKNRLNALKFL